LIFFTFGRNEKFSPTENLIILFKFLCIQG
jgi:hypothetical protein